MRNGSHKNLNHTLNIIIGISTSLFIDYVIYDTCKLNKYPEFYQAQAIPFSFFHYYA